MKLGMLSIKNISSTKDIREANKNGLYVHNYKLSRTAQYAFLLCTSYNYTYLIKAYVDGKKMLYMNTVRTVKERYQ